MSDNRPSRRDTKAKPILRPSRTLPRIPQKPRANRRLLVAFAGLLLLAAFIKLAPQLGSLDETPTELVGRWISDDPRYVGRTLVIEPKAVIFRAGLETAAAYDVRRIKRRQRPGDVEYSILGNSRTEGEYELVLRYRATDQTIELENPDGVIWKRAR